MVVKATALEGWEEGKVGWRGSARARRVGNALSRDNSEAIDDIARKERLSCHSHCFASEATCCPRKPDRTRYSLPRSRVVPEGIRGFSEAAS